MDEPKVRKVILDVTKLEDADAQGPWSIDEFVDLLRRLHAEGTAIEVRRSSWSVGFVAPVKKD